MGKSLAGKKLVAKNKKMLAFSCEEHCDSR
jgi:hypothetical protein